MVCIPIEQMLALILNVVITFLKMGGPEIRNTCCFFRGLELNPQHSHGSSQMSVTPLLEDLTASHTHTDIYEGKTPMHIK